MIPLVSIAGIAAFMIALGAVLGCFLGAEP
jgi:hypothetical protein